MRSLNILVYTSPPAPSPQDEKKNLENDALNCISQLKFLTVERKFSISAPSPSLNLNKNLTKTFFVKNHIFSMIHNGLEGGLYKVKFRGTVSESTSWSREGVHAGNWHRAKGGWSIRPRKMSRVIQSLHASKERNDLQKNIHKNTYSNIHIILFSSNIYQF